MTADPKPEPRRRARRLRRDAAETAAANEWHRRVTALGCRVCPQLGQRCSGVVQGHHVLRVQFIRSYADAHAHEHGLTRAEKAALLTRLTWDVRNGLGVCYRAHRRHHARVQPIPLHLVPAAAIVFATEIGLAWRIEADYPAV